MKINLLHTYQLPIYKQLQIEEALLRTNSDNWLILNEGSPKSAIMGISGKKEQVFDLRHIEKQPIPLIKRFSGGGTVVVDDNTLFVSIIFQNQDVECDPFPKSIMQWLEHKLKKAIPHKEFALKENDYVIGNYKCAGNAQYLRKNRWLHHATFLWDYTPEMMDYLLFPKKVPTYRGSRPHTEFLCKLKDHLPSKEAFFSALKEAFFEEYLINDYHLEDIAGIISEPHRKTTSLI